MRAIFATIALALSASAAVIYPRDTLSSLSGVANTVKGALGNTNVNSRQLPSLPVPVGTVGQALGGATGGATGGKLIRRDEPNVPGILVAVCAEVKPLVAKITADVDVKVVLEVLADVKVILAGAFVKVDALVKAKGAACLDVDGTVVAVAKIGESIAVLINLIVPCLLVVLKIQGAVSICADIIVSLCEIIVVIAKVEVDLVASIVVCLDVAVKADLQVAIFASLKAVLGL